MEYIRHLLTSSPPLLYHHHRSFDALSNRPYRPYSGLIMKIFTSSSSTSSSEDEKIALPIGPSKTTSVSLLNSQFTKVRSLVNSQFTEVRTILGKRLSRAVEWLQGLPSDRSMLAELKAWEGNGDIRARLVCQSPPSLSLRLT